MTRGLGFMTSNPDFGLYFMNDDTRKELTAWLEFYQELGIEGFYRRKPGEVEVPPILETPQMVQQVTADRKSVV